MFNLRDTSLRITRALPASASSSVNSDAIDLGHSTRGDVLADFELLVTAPAVNTTMAPDTRTFTYSLQHDDDPAFGTAVTIQPALITQTGAGGAGAAGATARFRLPTDCRRYVRLVVAAGASTGNASTVSATLEVVA